MRKQEILRDLEKIGAVITNSHLVYTSGKHGSAYVNKDALYPHTTLTVALCQELANCFLGDGVEVVVAPAVGAVILGFEVANHLNVLTTGGVASVYADKMEDGSFVIKRGYAKNVAGKNVLVVEDILNTGGSAKKTIDAVRACGGHVVALGALCNRGGVTTKDLGDIPKLVSLVNVKLDAYDEGDCPLCHAKVPINTEVGHGKEFLARQQVLAE